MMRDTCNCLTFDTLKSVFLNFLLFIIIIAIIIIRPKLRLKLKYRVELNFCGF